MTKRCEQCGGHLPTRHRADTLYCSTRCRVAAHRANKPVVPVELRERDRWVTWKSVQVGSRATKVPHTVKGRRASSTDPATWSPWSAVEPLERKGFVLDGDGVVCIDLDHCILDGRLTQVAAGILKQCGKTYVEISPSGDGLHIWGYANNIQGRKTSVGDQAVEVYGNGRYITVTEKTFGPRRSGLTDISGVISSLID